MAKIAIECGHGGKDTGSLGNGKREVDLNLIITNKLLNLLGKTHTVLGLGNDNTQPQERGKVAAKWGCDLHLSIHHNAGGGTGVEVWKPVFAKDKINKIATDIAVNISNSLSYRNRGVKTRWNSTKTADYYGVIRGNDLHNTLIVECCFIDNKTDIDKWNADKITNAIANAIYGNLGGKPAQSKPEPKKTNEQIAQEVINGKWGNNPKRKEDLIKAGYDYTVIQKIVNEMLKPKPEPVKPEPIKPPEPIMPPEPKPEPPKIVLVGDIDGDGKVTIKDALLALRHVAGITTLTAEQITRGDIDGDGKITVQDAVRILKLAAK